MLMRLFAFAATCFLGLSASAATAYQTIKNAHVSALTGNTWKVLAPNSQPIAEQRTEWLTNATARHDFTDEKWLKLEGKRSADWLHDGCRGLLGDGWHLPAQSDWEEDFAELKGSALNTQLGENSFWLSDVDQNKVGAGAEVSAVYAATLRNRTAIRIASQDAGKMPVVCVCGPRVIENDQRRSTQHCGQFQNESALSRLPEEVDVLLKKDKQPSLETFDAVQAACLARGKRIPRIEDVAALAPRLTQRLGKEGCVWSNTASSNSRMPREIWRLSGGPEAVGMASKNYPCFAICVL